MKKKHLFHLLYDGGILHRLGAFGSDEELEWLFPSAHIVHVRRVSAQEAGYYVMELAKDVCKTSDDSGRVPWEGKDLHIMAGNYKNKVTQGVLEAMTHLEPPLIPDSVTFRSVVVRWPTLQAWREQARLANGC